MSPRPCDGCVCLSDYCVFEKQTRAVTAQRYHSKKCESTVSYREDVLWPSLQGCRLGVGVLHYFCHYAGCDATTSPTSGVLYMTACTTLNTVAHLLSCSKSSTVVNDRNVPPPSPRTHVNFMNTNQQANVPADIPIVFCMYDTSASVSLFYFIVVQFFR